MAMPDAAVLGMSSVAQKAKEEVSQDKVRSK
jgi:hypothetical protein